MSYPFAGTSQAQSSSAHDHHRPHSPYHHPHTDDVDDDVDHRYSQPQSHYQPYSDRDLDDYPQYPTHQPYRADSPTHSHEGESYPIRDSGVAAAAANMTAEKAAYKGTYAANRGKSIWTPDDKRAFQKRSAPAKIVRVLFCILILGLILVLSIICLIVMFVRPPNVAISGLGVSSSSVEYSNGAFSFNVSVDISISNPNSISASVAKLAAQAYDATDRSTMLGTGEIRDQRIVPHANTTIKFPFTIEYNSTQDKDLSIISDIANKCGLNLEGLTTTNSSGSGNLDFDFDIDVDVAVLGITIPVNFSQDITFPCPLTGASVQSALSGLLSGVTSSALSSVATTTAQKRSLPSPTPRGLDQQREREREWLKTRSPVELVAVAADAFVKSLNKNQGAGALHDAL
ncbi:hypothetical protein ACQY0O_001811 [Thecaphora frezii]